MSRSVWKGPFVEQSLIKKLINKKITQIKNQLKLGQENQQLPDFVGISFLI